MIAALSLSMVLAMAAASDAQELSRPADEGVLLTFERAVTLATAQVASTKGGDAPDIPGLRRARLPNVRIEATGNTSRTLDLFSEGPFEVRYASSVLAFDYSLWDGGATAARIQAVERRLRRAGGTRQLDDSRFVELLDAFGGLYVAQRQEEIVRTLLDQSSSEAERAEIRLASGEITNLERLQRREEVLGLASRLLEIEAQQIESSRRVRLLTGVAADPRADLDPAEPIQLKAVHDTVRDDAIEAATIAVEESRARIRAMEASSGLRAMISGFTGLGAAESRFRGISSYGSFGIYGLRLQLSYPLFGGSMEISRVEARADLAQSLARLEEAIAAAKARASRYGLQREAAQRRAELLRQSIDIANAREEALARLVRGGVRSENDLQQARAERMRRQLDLLAAEVELWKANRLLAWMAGESVEKVSDRP